MAGAGPLSIASLEGRALTSVERSEPARRWPWSRPWSDALTDAVGLFVALRLIFGFFAIWLWWSQSVPGPCNFELARNGWTQIPPLADSGVEFPLVGVWQHWDACWYTKISTFGYHAGDNSVNFWPLFPLLVGVLQVLLGGAAALAGLIVVGVAYIVAMLGLDRLIGRDVNPETARWTVLLISVFPTAFFFFAPFTESLFLALAVWAMVGARERLWWLAAAAGVLAALTRIQGVFLVFPIGWEALMASWAGTAAAASIGAVVARVRAMPPRLFLAQLAAIAAPVAGFVAFLVYSKAVAGQTPLDTQDAWGGRNFHAPWEVIQASWSWAIDKHDPLQAFNLLTLAVFAWLAVAGIGVLPFSYFLYAAPQIALLATRIQPTPLTSTGRYLLVVFPAFVLIASIRDVRLRLAWLIGSVMFLALLLYTFLRGDFVA